MKNVVSNDWKTNLVVVLALALCVGYLVNKQNQALVSLFVISGVSYLLNKNVMMSLVVGIAVTSLLVTMNYVKRSEGMKNGAGMKNSFGMDNRPKRRGPGQRRAPSDKKQPVRFVPQALAEELAKKK
jgi:hypothetical protein